MQCQQQRTKHWFSGTSAWDTQVPKSSNGQLEKVLSQVFQTFKAILDHVTTAQWGKLQKSQYPKQEKFQTGNKEQGTWDSDLTGPFEVMSLNGAMYAMIFVNRGTRLTFMFSITRKNQTHECVQNLAQHLRRLNKPFTRLHSDGEPVFTSSQMKKVLNEFGISQTTSAPETPQHNGIAERGIRTMVECARTMMIAARAPKNLWAYALAHATHVWNRLPHTANPRNCTPHELFYGTPPTWKHIRIWGCKCFVHIDRQKRKKLDPKVYKARYLGWDNVTRSHIVQKLSNQRVEKSLHVTFNESMDDITRNNIDDPMQVTREYDDESEIHITPKRANERQNEEQNEQEQTQQETLQDELETNDQNQQDTKIDSESPNSEQDNNDYQEPGGARVREEMESQSRKTNTRMRNELETREGWTQKLTRFDPTIQYNTDNAPGPITRSMTKQVEDALLTTTFDTDEPKTLNEALKHPAAEKWLNAMDEEYKSHMKMGTWKLTTLPPNRKAIGSKWTYRLKRDANGTITRYKARLVAQGFNQIEGVDYNEITAPVARSSTIRILMSITASMGLEAGSSDISTAYLNGNLKETIYMRQPTRFKQETKGGKELVCELKKSIYGLKQSGREWYLTLDSWLKSIGMKKSKYDPCLYTHKKGKDFMHVAIYVDDIIYVSNSKDLIKEFRKNIDKKFEAKHDKELTEILGVKIQKNKQEGTVKMSQARYIDDILKRFGMENCKTAPTPATTSLNQIEDTTSEKIEVPYRELVGALLYLAIQTRPDIAWAVAAVARHSEEPKQIHWSAAKRILRYLKGTRELGMFCFILFCFVLFCFCFVLFCFVLFCFVLFCFVLFLFCFVLICIVLFCFVLFCIVLFC